MTLGVSFDWASSGLLNTAQNRNTVSFGSSTDSIFGSSLYTSSSTSSTTSSSKLQNIIESVEAMVAMGYSVEEAIEQLDISDDYVDDVRAYFSIGTDTQEKWISNYMKANSCSRAEALAKYNEKNGIDCDTQISTVSYTTSVSTEKKYNDETIKYISDELYNSREYSNGWFWTWGKDSDETVFEKYFTEKDMSSADMVAVALQFNTVHESLSDVLDYTFKNNEEKRIQYQETYAKALIEQAKAGNEDAINLLCTEIRTSKQENGVVEAFMKNADSEVLEIVSQAYGMTALTERIDDIFDDNQAKEYIHMIENANM